MQFLNHYLENQGKKCLKKEIGIISISLCMLCVCSCGTVKKVDESQIVSDLNQTEIGMYSLQNTKNNMNVEEVVIEKRLSEKKQDDIFAEIHMTDGEYSRISYYILHYIKYEEGWNLEYYEKYDEDIYTVEDVNFLDNLAETYAQDYFVDLGIDEYEQMSKRVSDGNQYAEYTFGVEEEFKYCSIGGNITIFFEFGFSEEGCNWYENIDDSNLTCEWNVIGNWGGEIIAEGSDERDTIEFSIEQINDGQLYITGLKDTHYYWFTAPSSTRNYIDDPGWVDAEITTNHIKFSLGSGAKNDIVFYRDIAYVENNILYDADTFHKLPVNLITLIPDEQQLNNRQFYDKAGECYAGVFYAGYVVGDSDDNEAANTYVLDGHYTSLTGEVHAPDSCESEPCDVRIYGDGKLLYEYTGGQKSADFMIDVTGINKLEICMGRIFSEYRGGFGIINHVPTVYLDNMWLE